MLKRFISYYRPYKALFSLDIVAAVIGSLLSIAFPQITRELLRTYIPNKNWSMMITLFAVMFAIYLVQTFTTYLRVRWGHQLGVFMESDMRQDLFEHLQRQSFTYFDNTKTGHLMSRITNDLFMITETAHHGPEDLLISVVVIIGSYIVMFFNSVPLALISIIPLPFMLFYGIYFGRRLKEGFRAVRSTVADVNSVVENSIQGVREVQSYTSETEENQKFKEVNLLFQKAKSRQYKIMARYESTMMFFREMYYFVTVAGGAVLIYNDIVVVYDLVAFILFVSIVLPPIDRLIGFTEQLQQGMAAFERFIEVMDIQSDINDIEGARDLQISDGTVTFTDVTFGYENEKDTVLENVSMTVEGGSTVALVGESGAGKSTLVSLIPRFYEAQKGAVLIDGQDVTRLTKKSLRSQIGFVQQNVFLFDGTIRENLLYGKKDATDDELYEALKMANLTSFISSLPLGLDTPVKEHGTRLSGGQKQRISIARVFLKNPKIIIFDEATSSLDSESERQIQEAFTRLAAGRTAIVIAHRLSTVRNARSIFVLDSKKIVENGSHPQLLEQNGLYARLYRNQSL
ncbi:MAG: ABC transporter ATP-binding protein [Sphaerochaetaceae bacterium]|nr:ABC transporter ATP-binding protein [Sphaerochaetaceae bacterium]